MKISIYGLVGLLLLSACESKHSEQTHQQASTIDTLAYQIKGDSARSSTCIRPDSLCATASFLYPVFENKQALTDSILRDAIAYSGYFDGEDPKQLPPTTPKQVVQDFVKGFDEFVNDQKKRFPNEPILGGNWSTEVKARVIRQTSKIICLSVFSFNYSGGAHPITNELYANYTPDGHRINLSDLLKPNYEKQLSTIAENVFRKQEGLKDGDSYAGKYFFPKDAFLLNNNFTIRKEGLLFRYNPYEIKAYAEGPTELLIPFQDIKIILKSDSPLQASI
ncbi:MAG: DUF3298 domain-containing protein [Siphonobacter sp.]